MVVPIVDMGINAVNLTVNSMLLAFGSSGSRIRVPGKIIEHAPYGRIDMSDIKIKIGVDRIDFPFFSSTQGRRGPDKDTKKYGKQADHSFHGDTSCRVYKNCLTRII